MEINKILKADILDIIFEGRNKDYGAYDLRKNYRKRMIMSVMGMISLMVLIFGSYVIANEISDNESHPMVVDKIIELIEVHPDEKKPEPVMPPKLPKAEPPKIETIKSTAPLIVDDKDVKEEDKPPVQELLDDARIGVVSQAGEKFDGIVAPPAAIEGRGIVDAPKPIEDDKNTIFTKVEIESIYPGGSSAWMRYLNKTFRYPEEGVENQIQGTVIVQFIVDQEGNVSDVEAIGGPTNGGLREEAVRVIKKSGKWEAAIQNGRKVKSYKKQPITFKLQSE